MEAGRQVQIGCREVLLFLGVGLVLAGCGAGKILVLKPAEATTRVSSVEIAEGASTVKVPDEVKKSFEEELGRLLYAEGAFQRGPDLKITYRFIQHDPGNQFTRWFWGGIGNAGEGSITVEAKYFEASDRELATIQAEGKIGSGAFGGSFDLAVQKAAEKIAEYTKQNFKEETGRAADQPGTQAETREMPKTRRYSDPNRE